MKFDLAEESQIDGDMRGKWFGPAEEATNVKGTNLFSLKYEKNIATKKDVICQMIKCDQAEECWIDSDALGKWRGKKCEKHKTHSKKGWENIATKCKMIKRDQAEECRTDGDMREMIYSAGVLWW